MRFVSNQKNLSLVTETALKELRQGQATADFHEKIGD